LLHASSSIVTKIVPRTNIIVNQLLTPAGVQSESRREGKYIKIILSLLQSTSSAVVYECAVTLVSLSQAPTAIRAAANCYCQLLVSQSDNNVKLIVLDRLQVCHSYSLAEIARNQKLRKPWTAK